MNNSVNYSSFIDMMIDSDEEYEAYGYGAQLRQTDPVGQPRQAYIIGSETESGEFTTWYGE